MPALSTFEFLYAATSLLVIAVLFRRLRALEAGPEDRADAETGAGAGQHAREEETAPRAAAPADAVPLVDLLLSPITVIIGQCELARAGGAGNARLDVIERHARRAADLLRRPAAGTLTATGARAPQVPVGPVSPDARLLQPHACVRAAVDSHAALASERGVAVHLNIDATPSIRANPFLLGHALRHLVRASLEAAPRGVGDVTVAVGELDGEVLFAVADDGPGLGAEQLAAIFDPGMRSDDPWGAGALAYAVVHAVTQALGATLLLDTAPGAGTRATIRMPAAATALPAVDAGPGREAADPTAAPVPQAAREPMRW